MKTILSDFALIIAWKKEKGKGIYTKVLHLYGFSTIITRYSKQKGCFL